MDIQSMIDWTSIQKIQKVDKKRYDKDCKSLLKELKSAKNVLTEMYLTMVWESNTTKNIGNIKSL